MTQDRSAPVTAAVLLAGAAFGAAAVFLGAGVLAGAWPKGWAALVCALVLAALGATALAAGRGNRTAPRDAPGLVKPDKVPSGKPVSGRTSVVAAGVAWLLAVVAAGSWGISTMDDDEGGGGRAEGDRTPEASAPPAREKSRLAWSVPAVGVKYDTGVGAWAFGDTVAQGRLDGLFAYGAADGAVRWSVSAPAREALCGMSPGIEQGIGLIAYGRHDKPCATLLAVRASDGKVLWRTGLTGEGLTERGIAVGGGTAVTAEDGAVRGRSATTGEQRWRRVLDPGCAVLAVDADATRTLVVEQCGKAARLVALDTPTGARKWLRELPVESGAEASVVSVSPVVLAVDEEDKRGTHAFLGFDDTGAPTVTVPLSRPEGLLSAPGGVGDGRTAEPVVRDGRLITLVERGELVPDRVAAYSLKDGRRIWEYASEQQTAALTAHSDGRVAVLESHSDARVVLLDPGTGRPGRVRDPEDPKAVVSIYPELLVTSGGHHVVVNHTLMETEPSAFGLS
ncbi:PQQ-binding-like beta-propeller repeat protein [Streptomyces sp. NPDC059247]|uniref:outer membrane protein assembly factor BamB family protein n=1 Tax=Streptomyces sp. NPDC059247 TaxID=3346790 RepID=UPI0036B4DAE0